MQTNTQDTLNTLPTLLAYPAFLAGYRTVNEALDDRLFSNYLSAFIEQDVMSFVVPHAMIDSDDTQSQLLSRFSNPTTSEPLARLCSDGASKLPSFILPIVLDSLAKKRDIHRMTFLVAAYGHYLSTNVDDKGDRYESSEPHLWQDDWAKINDNDVTAFLDISPFASAHLRTYSHFVAMYKSYRTQLAKYGVIFLLKQMAYNRLAV